MFTAAGRSIHRIAIAGALICTYLWGANARADTLANIEEKVGKGRQVELWTTDSETVAFLNASAKTNDETLKRTALTVARAIAGAGQTKRVLVVFRDPSDPNIKCTTITAEQLAKTDEAVVPLLAVIQGQEANVKVDSQAKGESNSDVRYQAERAKLIGHIKSMETKGGNPKPLYQELAKVDSMYKAGDIYGARLGLGHLEKLATKQEHATQPVSESHVARPEAAELDIFGNGNMSADEFHKKMEQQVLARDLGELIPSPGPLRVERYRIAKAIQYYQVQGRNVVGYRSAFKSIDDLALESVQDKRKMPTLVDKVKYMLQQLNLPEKVTPGQQEELKKTVDLSQIASFRDFSRPTKVEYIERELNRNAMKLEDIDREFKEMAQSMKDGEAALNRGQFSEAERQYRRALELVDRCYGPDHPDALVCLHHLADACYGLKKHSDSLSALKTLLAIKEKHGGASDPELVPVLFKLAKNYEKLGMTREAESFYRRALKKGEETYGTNNSFVATIMESFAAMLKRAQIHLPEAEKLEERVRDIRGNQSLPSQFTTSVLTQLAVSIAPGSEESLLLQEKARTHDKLALSGKMRSLRTHTEHADLSVAPSTVQNLTPMLGTIVGAILLVVLGVGGYNLAVSNGIIPAFSISGPSSSTPAAKPLSAQPKALVFQTPDATKKVVLLNDTEAAVVRRGIMIKCGYTSNGATLECRPKTSESVLYTYTHIPEGLTDDENSTLYASDSPEALVINKMRHFAAVLQRYYAANRSYPAKIEYVLSDPSISYNNPFTGKSCFPKKKDLPGDQKDISDFGINDYAILEAATRELGQWTPVAKEEPGTIEFYRTATGPDGDSIYIRCTDRNGRFVRGSQPGTTYLITLAQGQIKTGR